MEEKVDITISELENFVGSRLWRVLVQAMLARTNEKYERLVTLDPSKEATELARAQGFIEGLSYIMDYPALLKEQIEYERTEEERKNA